MSCDEPRWLNSLSDFFLCFSFSSQVGPRLAWLHQCQSDDDTGAAGRRIIGGFGDLSPCFLISHHRAAADGESLRGLGRPAIIVHPSHLFPHSWQNDTVSTRLYHQPSQDQRHAGHSRTSNHWYTILRGECHRVICTEHHHIMAHLELSKLSI